MRIGISDVGSLKEAAKLMHDVEAMSGAVISAIEVASKSAGVLGAKVAQVNANAPQMQGLLEVFSQAFQQTFNQWKGIDEAARDGIAEMRAEIGGIVGGIRVATSHISAAIDEIKGNTSLDAVAQKITDIMAQTRSLVGMQSALGEMATTRQEATAGGTQGPDIQTTVTLAVADAFREPITTLAGEVSRVQAESERATRAGLNVMTAIESAIKKINVPLSQVQAGIDEAALAQKIVDELLKVLPQQQQTQPAVTSGRRSKFDRDTDTALGKIDLFFSSEWKLFTDRFGDMRDKVDNIFKSTDGLGEKFDKLKGRVSDLMSSYRKNAAAAASKQPAPATGSVDAPSGGDGTPTTSSGSGKKRSAVKKTGRQRDG